MENYNPGLHILTEINDCNFDKTKNKNEWNLFVKKIISMHNLMEVGNVLHEFDGGGFTAVHCLTESHIAIHTWPEFNIVTFDVFLCNYKRDNTKIVHFITNEIIAYFGGNIYQQNTVKR